MKLYEPVSILLGIVLIVSVISDKLSARQDRKDLKQQIDQSVELSQKVSELSLNTVEISKQLNATIKEKAELDKKYEQQIQEKDEKVGEQFGLLTSQAQTIAQTTPASDTIKHYQTSEAFMKLHDGKVTDPSLAWNSTFINTQTTEYELLKQQLEITKKENEKLSLTLSKESEKNVDLSEKLNTKSLDLEKTVGKVQLIENTLYAQKGWMARIKQIIFWSVVLGCISGLLYVSFHVYQIVGFKKKLNVEADRRRLANKDKYDAEFKSNEMAAAIKTFLHVNEDGNEVMKKIINANGLKKVFENCPELKNDISGS